MKTITLENAVELLDECSAVIYDDVHLGYPDISELTGEGDNVFLQLGDEDGVYWRFEEGNNREVTLVGSSMFLQDTEGNQCQVTLLVPQKFETFL